MSAIFHAGPARARARALAPAALSDRTVIVRDSGVSRRINRIRRVRVPRCDGSSFAWPRAGPRAAESRNSRSAAGGSRNSSPRPSGTVDRRRGATVRSRATPASTRISGRRSRARWRGQQVGSTRRPPGSARRSRRAIEGSEERTSRVEPPTVCCHSAMRPSGGHESFLAHGEYSGQRLVQR